MYEKEFGEVRKYETPGFVREYVVINKGELIKQDFYRSLVGKLLYYVIKIGVDCANAVRELSQHVINPGTEHWREMKRVVGYIKYKEQHKLIFKKPLSLNPINMSDSNYATNIEDRKSVSI